MVWRRWHEISWRNCTTHSCRPATWGSCWGTAGSKCWPRPATKGDHTIPLYHGSHVTVQNTKKDSTVANLLHDEVAREKEQDLSSLAQIMNLLVFLWFHLLTQIACCIITFWFQESQETALMIAARKGNVGIVRKLIYYGAIVNLTNKVNQCHFWKCLLAHNLVQWV